MSMQVDLAGMVATTAAQDILNSLTTKQRDTLLKEALIRHINEASSGNRWDIDSAVQNRLLKLSLERLAEAEVQEVLREKAHKAVGEVIDAFAINAAAALSRELQSTYKTLVERSEQRVR